MRRVNVRGVPALEMATTSKIQALKVLEEAAELVEAVKHLWRKRYEYHVGDAIGRAIVDNARDAAIAEAADVITATVGLLVAMGCDEVDIADAMQECAERQERRGRG